MEINTMLIYHRTKKARKVDYMKKKIWVSLSIVLLLCAGYLGGIYYYLDKFAANTTFGDVNISGLTVSQAAQKIQQEISAKSISINENGQEIAKVSLKDLGAEYQLETILNQAMQSQDPAEWGLTFFRKSEFEGVTEELVKADIGLLEQELKAQGVVNQDRIAPTPAEILYDQDKGYYIKESVKGTQIDYSTLLNTIVEQLGKANPIVDVKSSYADATITAETDVVKDTMALIEQVVNKSMVLKIAGEEVVIPAQTIASWIYFDDNNRLTVDEALVTEYLNELNEKYSTFDKERKFKSTLQGDVTVPPGILGWKIDIEAELPQLMNDLSGTRDVKREPAIYSTGGIANAKDDIGGTYIEVDISHQMMYFYVDGEPVVSTNVVTGQPGSPTIPGANAVNEMLTNTNLTGYNPFLKVNYSVPVQYWIRFDNNSQGIHDASWQWNFGGDTHLWSGSLGCVNTPLEDIAYIFEKVDYGTPVVVFE